MALAIETGTSARNYRPIDALMGYFSAKLQAFRRQAAASRTAQEL